MSPTKHGTRSTYGALLTTELLTQAVHDFGIEANAQAAWSLALTDRHRQKHEDCGLAFQPFQDTTAS
jgi:hypothetical protein